MPSCIHQLPAAQLAQELKNIAVKWAVDYYYCYYDCYHCGCVYKSDACAIVVDCGKCQTTSKTQTDKETRPFVCPFVRSVYQGRPSYGWTKRDAS